MLFHNKNDEGRDLVSRAGTRGQKLSSIARLDTAAGGGTNLRRSFVLIAANACALPLFCGLTLQPPALKAQAAPENPEFAADCQRGQAALKSDDQAREMEQFRAAVRVDPLDSPAHYRPFRLRQTIFLNEEVREEILLYHDIRQAQDRVAELYCRMNRKPEARCNLRSEGKK
jgi:hypothetical protein